MDTNIFRSPTKEELAERDEYGRTTIFLNPNIENISIFEKFNDILIELEQEATRDRFPFCRRCARLDFQQEIKKVEFELSATEGELISEFQLNKIKIPSKEELRDTYGLNRFNFKDKSIAMDTAAEVISGQVIHKQVQIGVYENYICKKRGCGFSLFIPNELIKEREIANIPIKIKK